ncbi:MAG: hypothetical protein COB02_07685 [Candidatus Cloacimonadota bacterium]|nr:MAG: hypothetical protein COB02_07685 [Candidatus Cloacimonadota bacterium]
MEDVNNFITILALFKSWLENNKKQISQNFNFLSLNLDTIFLLNSKWYFELQLVGLFDSLERYAVEWLIHIRQSDDKVFFNLTYSKVIGVMKKI